MLGFGVDDNYQIQSTTLQSIKIPFGSAAVAKPTENVYLQGTLTPTGAVADKGEIIAFARVQRRLERISDGPADELDLDGESTVARHRHRRRPTRSGAIPDGTYRYKIVYVNANGNESAASAEIGPFTITNPTTDAVDLTIPAASPDYTTTRIYRASGTGPTFTYQQVADIAGSSTTYTDTPATTTSQTLTESGMLAGASYSYYVTWYNSTTGQESRPTSVDRAASRRRRWTEDLA